MRTKPLWKQRHPQRSEPKDIFAWKKQVEEHLYGTPEMQDALLKAWGYRPYKRKDLRKKPLRDKMHRTSLRARIREAEILALRMQGLSFRQISPRLGISHVTASKRYWWAMQENLRADDYRIDCLRKIRAQVEAWNRDYEDVAP